jgi:hypothetical protein
MMKKAAVTVGAVRLVYGVVALVSPGRVLRMYDDREHAVPDELIVRVLGGRHVLQAAVTLASPRPAVLRWGAAADATHAVSMAMLSWLDDSRRVAAGREAVAAGLLTAVGTVTARRVPADR